MYYADRESKRILDYPGVTARVCKMFGDDVLNHEGTIDRSALASRVFADSGKLHLLNEILHPLVKKDFECWITLYQGSPYCVQEAAILLESGFGELFDRIIVVTAPPDTRFERVNRRDNITRDQFQQRSEKQWPEDEKLKFADFVVLNDNEHLIIPQVINIHNEILKLT